MIVESLDPNKCFGPDKISILIVKMCSISLCKPLEITFKSCIIKDEFPSEWKKANTVPVYKKNAVPVHNNP